MRVGIYASYTRSEPTAAAMLLANTLAKIGLDVSWLASPGSEENVHRNWDRRVLSDGDIPPERWVKQLDTVIWFKSASSALNRHLSGQSDLKQILILSRPPLNYRDLSALFDKIIIPASHPDNIAAMKDRLGSPDSRLNLVSCPWITGIKYIATTPNQPRTVLVYCGGKTWRQHGHELIAMGSQFVATRKLKQWDICLSFDDAPGNGAEPSLSRAVRAGNGRLKIAPQPRLDQLPTLIRNAGRLVLPAFQGEWGIFERWAERLGTPVLSWDKVAEENKERSSDTLDNMNRPRPGIAGCAPIPFDPEIMLEAIVKSCTVNVLRVPAPAEDSAAFYRFWRQAIL